MTKILIIRFSSIGDIVLTTPVIRCIKKQLPQAEVHYLTKKSFSGVLSQNPYIDHLHLLDDKLSDTLKILKAEKFDYIIDLHHNLRTLIVKASLRKPAFSFNKLNVEKWLIVAFKINRLPDKHIVDRYFETTVKLGIRNDGEGLDYFIHQNDIINKESLPESFRNGYIGFVIGAKHNTKKLPADKIADVIQKLQRPVVLIGGKEDAEEGNEIASRTENCYNACGKFNLGQSASLVQQADAIIAHDTGFMHIAAALKKPIVSVWGNTIPGFGMYPYLTSRSVMVENGDLKCRPCSKIGYNQCPKGHFKCMNDIDTYQIVHAVTDLNL